MNDFKDRLLAALNKATNNEILPGDESELAENPMNATIEALNLPSDWKQSVADYKQATADLPMNMGMGTMGSIKSADMGKGLAKQALQKLEMAKHLDKPLTTAEELLLSKAQGKTVTVIPTAQEKAGFAKLKGMMGK